MTEPLKCETCGNPATVHLTQIVNNKMIKAEYCEACAKKKGLLNPNLLALPDLFAKKGHIGVPLTKVIAQPIDPMNVETLVCPQCGMNASEFRKTARFGCATCYTSLTPIVTSLLSGIYNNPKHKGKIPVSKPIDPSVMQKEVSELEKKLKKVIKEENYEAAAELRDQIAEMKAKINAMLEEKK